MPLVSLASHNDLIGAGVGEIQEVRSHFLRKGITDYWGMSHSWTCTLTAHIL